jgi:hypothetical protein
MNDLENAARAFSDTGSDLKVDAQRIVATFAEKTAVCVERTFPSATQIAQAWPPTWRPS